MGSVMTRYVNTENASPDTQGFEIDATEILQMSLSHQQQLALINLVRVDNPDMKQKMITQNLRLVVNIARRYSNHGVAFLELIREGTMGLIHALESFERDGGFRFESYAVQCVRHEIERVIMNQNNHRSLAEF
jgi:DNA-directed RNA polymerase sigma subunit (sigma70/sigma32)